MAFVNASLDTAHEIHVRQHSHTIGCIGMSSGIAQPQHRTENVIDSQACKCVLSCCQERHCKALWAPACETGPASSAGAKYVDRTLKVQPASGQNCPRDTWQHASGDMFEQSVVAISREACVACSQRRRRLCQRPDTCHAPGASRIRTETFCRGTAARV